MDAILEMFRGLIESQGAHVEIVSKVLMVIGGLRVIFKPLMSLIQAVVGLSPSVKDDSILSMIIESKVYKVIAYALDWSASIKLPKKEEVK